MFPKKKAKKKKKTKFLCTITILDNTKTKSRIKTIFWFLVKHYISVASGDFSTRGCCPKNNFHFFKFYFILRSFLQNLSITASYNFSLFLSNLTLDFLSIDISTNHFSFFWWCFTYTVHSWKLTDALVEGIMQIKCTY